MAPIQPAPHRTAKPVKSILKTSSTIFHVARPAKSESLFTSNKKDKRRIKHAQLMSKVTKTQTKKPKRRRANKKLVTTLDALADALPDDDDDGNGGDAPAGERPDQRVNIIKRKSMKSRPGALKRKQRLDNEERARFARNMAQMAAATPLAETNGNSMATSSDAKIAATSTQKWTALRGFISQTLEKKPDFEQQGT